MSQLSNLFRSTQPNDRETMIEGWLRRVPDKRPWVDKTFYLEKVKGQTVQTANQTILPWEVFDDLRLVSWNVE